MPTGFGLFPFGLSPAGYGAPDGAPLPGDAYTLSVDTVLARDLDLKAKDYAVRLDETGAPHDEMDPLAQNVILRLSTRRGRLPFDPSFGNDFFNLRRAPLDLRAAAESAAALALQELVDAGDVAIVSVEADRTGGLGVMAVTWRDLRTSRERTTRTPRPAF